LKGEINEGNRHFLKGRTIGKCMMDRRNKTRVLSHFVVPLDEGVLKAVRLSSLASRNHRALQCNHCQAVARGLERSMERDCRHNSCFNSYRQTLITQSLSSLVGQRLLSKIPGLGLIFWFNAHIWCLDCPRIQLIHRVHTGRDRVCSGDTFWSGIASCVLWIWRYQIGKIRLTVKLRWTFLGVFWDSWRAQHQRRGVWGVPRS